MARSVPDILEAAGTNRSELLCYASRSAKHQIKTMKIANLEFIPVSVPYTHREASSLVNRDGVTDVIVKATTDDGLTGWGESCSGANLESVLEALKGMSPFVLGESPWESECIRAEICHRGI